MSKEASISKATRTLADSLRDGMTVGEKGQISTPADFAEKNLPEGLTLEQVKLLQDYRDQLPAALTLAAGELAVPAFKADKNLVEANASLAFGSDRINATVLRDYVNGKETAKGHVVVAYETNAVGNYKADLGLALSHVRALAAKEL